MSSVLARGKTHVARTRPRTGRNRGERGRDERRPSASRGGVSR
jgi:hypothetical protein